MKHDQPDRWSRQRVKTQNNRKTRNVKIKTRQMFLDPDRKLNSAVNQKQ